MPTIGTISHTGTMLGTIPPTYTIDGAQILPLAPRIDTTPPTDINVA